MTKRLYSTEQVLDALVSDDEDFALDDEDEPMMAVPDDYDDGTPSTFTLSYSRPVDSWSACSVDSCSVVKQ